MLQIRPITADELSWFAGLQGEDADALRDSLASQWASGSSRPEWCFIAERGGVPLARVAYAADPLGGGVETLEHRVVGLWAADWNTALTDATRLVRETIPVDATTVDLRLNAEVHTHVDERRHMAEAAGFDLFQEKQGFTWTDRGEAIAPPSRLVLRSLREIGRTAFAEILGRGPEATLDRNDRYYWTVCGPAGWADEMLGYAGPDDEDSFLAAYTPSGAPVGYVGVVDFDEPSTSTIAHIGVVPEQRGHRYGEELLRAGMLASRERGFSHMLSDVDTENGPMIGAMLRAGHSPTTRPWHVWHYRWTRAGQ
jgi:ribosomal protein S18 acetylase RimI-like enzyme